MQNKHSLLIKEAKKNDVPCPFAKIYLFTRFLSYKTLEQNFEAKCFETCNSVDH